MYCNRFGVFCADTRAIYFTSICSRFTSISSSCTRLSALANWFFKFLISSDWREYALRNWKLENINHNWIHNSKRLCKFYVDRSHLIFGINGIDILGRTIRRAILRADEIVLQIGYVFDIGALMPEQRLQLMEFCTLICWRFLVFLRDLRKNGNINHLFIETLPFKINSDRLSNYVLLCTCGR